MEQQELIVVENDILDLELDTPNALYTKEQKLEAVNLYLKTGVIAEVSRTLGIPHTTIINWKERGTWWNEVCTRYRQDKQIELDTKLTETIHKTIEQLTDRLENGDEKLSRNGDLERVPLSGRDLATILSTLYEKRALIRGEATSIKTESTTALKTLEDRFKTFAIQIKEKDVIDSQ